jgi:hypothetical protein
MFGWANIRNQNLFVGVLSGEIFFFEINDFSFSNSLEIKILFLLGNNLNRNNN